MTFFSLEIIMLRELFESSYGMMYKIAMGTLRKYNNHLRHYKSFEQEKYILLGFSLIFI